MSKLLSQLGQALRDAKSPSTDESMPKETQSQRARRYTQCGQSGASDPDCWADVKYGPANNEQEPEPDEDESKNQKHLRLRSSSFNSVYIVT